MANVTVFCFLASYGVALLLEIYRLKNRGQTVRWLTVAVATAGFVAHNWYLFNRFRQTELPPLLASTHDWMLVLAWVLVLFYLFLTLVQKDLAIGLFILPVVLLLVVSTYFLSREPNRAINSTIARREWGMLHASLLVFGMAAGAAGLVSGIMYLVQHRRLRTRHAETQGLHIPSLARLAQVNRWSMLLTFFCLTLGFASGVYLQLNPPQGLATVSYRDPAVVISAALWLILAALFVRLFVRQSPSGRQVAWLTVMGCGFVLLTVLGLQVLTGTIHGAPVVSAHGGSARGLIAAGDTGVQVVAGLEVHP